MLVNLSQYCEPVGIFNNRNLFVLSIVFHFTHLSYIIIIINNNNNKINYAPTLDYKQPTELCLRGCGYTTPPDFTEMWRLLLCFSWDMRSFWHNMASWAEKPHSFPMSFLNTIILILQLVHLILLNKRALFSLSVNLMFVFKGNGSKHKKSALHLDLIFHIHLI